MGGHPSIPTELQSAKDLEKAAAEYGRPMTVLYFGDLGDAGYTIYNVCRGGVLAWCGTPLEFRHCGLTLEQAQRYGVPVDPDKPGQYQWAALTDQAAAEIITDATAGFVDAAQIAAVEAQESAATARFREAMADLADDCNE
jgi:hypothetical protein